VVGALACGAARGLRTGLKGFSVHEYSKTLVLAPSCSTAAKPRIFPGRDLDEFRSLMDKSDIRGSKTALRVAETEMELQAPGGQRRLKKKHSPVSRGWR